MFSQTHLVTLLQISILNKVHFLDPNSFAKNQFDLKNVFQNCRYQIVGFRDFTS
jgi:hypothetical protein